MSVQVSDPGFHIFHWHNDTAPPRVPDLQPFSVDRGFLSQFQFYTMLPRTPFLQQPAAPFLSQGAVAIYLIPLKITVQSHLQLQHIPHSWHPCSSPWLSLRLSGSRFHANSTARSHTCSSKSLFSHISYNTHQLFCDLSPFRLNSDSIWRARSTQMGSLCWRLACSSETLSPDLRQHPGHAHSSRPDCILLMSLALW